MAQVADVENSKWFVDNWSSDEISMVVEGIGIYWKFFMRFIGVKEEAIETCCASNSKHCDINQLAIDVFEKKLRSCEARMTWEEIENALEWIGKNMLIENIKDKLGLPLKQDASRCQSLKCSDNVLAVVALQIKNYWKSLAKSMELSSDDISTIEEDHQSYPVEEKAYQFLWGLKQQLPAEEVLSNVRNTMLKCMPYGKCKEIFIKLCQFFSDENLWDIVLDEALIEIDEEIHYISYGNSECDFYIVSHSSEREQLLMKKALNHFDEHAEEHMNSTNIRISIEAGTCAWLNLSDFHEQNCKSYVKRYYGNSIFFSFNYGCSDENLVEGFKDFCKKRGAGFMIKDYNLMKHFEFLKLQEFATENEHFLMHQSSHKMDHIGVEEKTRVIYFIKKSCAKILNNLMQDIKDSAAFVQMFFLLHKKSLIGKVSSFISLIVIPTESEPLINEIHNKCKYCDTFVMTEDTFQHFDDNVEDGLLEKLLDYIESKTWRALRKYRFSNFKYILANIFGFMASQSTDLIPCLSEKISKQINNGMILFNPTQLEISNSKDKRVLLIGDYGSGKTLVARSLIKTLTFNLESHDYIHYCQLWLFK